MKESNIINTRFLMSAGALIQLFALGTGGGVIGIIARNELNGRHIPESLLWVATFAWVTTLLIFIIQIFCSPLSSEGLILYALFVSTAYVVSTIFFGIFETVPVTLENKGLLVLLLAIGTICAYVGLACWGGMEIHDEKKRKNKSEKNTPKEDKVEMTLIEETALKTEKETSSAKMEEPEGETKETPIKEQLI